MKMMLTGKGPIKCAAAVALAVALLACLSCATNRGAQAGGQQPELLMEDNLATLKAGGSWALVSFESGGMTTALDRTDNLIAGAFTLEILKADGAAENEFRLAGRGMPNRYNTTVTVEHDGRLKMLVLAATLMAAFAEPEALKEREFFQFIERMQALSRRDGGLIIATTDADGKPVTLRFEPFSAP